MSDFTITLPASEGSRFAPGAFGAIIGQEIPVRLTVVDWVRGIVRSATVADGGRAVTIRIDVPDCPICQRAMKDRASLYAIPEPGGEMAALDLERAIAECEDVLDAHPEHEPEERDGWPPLFGPAGQAWS